MHQDPWELWCHCCYMLMISSWCPKPLSVKLSKTKAGSTLQCVRFCAEWCSCREGGQLQVPGRCFICHHSSNTEDEVWGQLRGRLLLLWGRSALLGARDPAMQWKIYDALILPVLSSAYEMLLWIQIMVKEHNSCIEAQTVAEFWNAHSNCVYWQYWVVSLYSLTVGSRCRFARIVTYTRLVKFALVSDGNELSFAEYILWIYTSELHSLMHSLGLLLCGTSCALQAPGSCLLVMWCQFMRPA